MRPPAPPASSDGVELYIDMHRQSVAGKNQPAVPSWSIYCSMPYRRCRTFASALATGLELDELEAAEGWAGAAEVADEALGAAAAPELAACNKPAIGQSALPCSCHAFHAASRTKRAEPDQPYLPHDRDKQVPFGPKRTCHRELKWSSRTV